MPDPAETPVPPRQNPVRRLARPAVALAAVVLFQLLFASVFVAVLHHPVPHQAPVAVAGRSPVAQAVSSHGGERSYWSPSRPPARPGPRSPAGR
jgi:hypothetical protein